MHLNLGLLLNYVIQTFLSITYDIVSLLLYILLDFVLQLQNYTVINFKLLREAALVT